MLGDSKINGKRLMWTDYLLGSIPFILVFCVYGFYAVARHRANSMDKILPYPSQMVSSMAELTGVDDIIAYMRGEIDFDELKPKLVFLTDTFTSLIRISVGLSLSTIVGLVLGLHLAYFRTFRTIAIPEEQIVSAKTLGASKWSIVYQTLLPQIMPQLIHSVRKCLGAAWIFLITSEMLAGLEGLGYQIGLQRRRSGMDIIFPYVIWITLLGYVADVVLRRFSSWRYPWYQKQKK